MAFLHKLKVFLKRSLPEPFVAAILRSKWEKMKEIDLSKIELIRQQSNEFLTDARKLEIFLPQLGLNNELLHQIPDELYPYAGKGLLHWQYPNQFSKYLVLLSKLKIESYLEIGVRHGGTFVITVEYLNKFHPLQKAIGLDIGYAPSVAVYSKINKKVRFFQADTQTERFTDFLEKEKQFDLVFIDGNHDEVACKNDYDAVKEMAGIIVLHDIASDSCPGVQKLWKQLREKDIFVCYEFTEQYPVVVERTGENFFGIGVAIKKTYLAGKDIILEG